VPDMLAHWEVAEAARARLLAGPLTRILAAELDAYKVGAQGPDVLFYSHIWSGRGSSKDLAFLMHQQRMRGVFRSLLTGAAGLPADQRSIAIAFTCGFATHLCLDAEAHPWIMYWTGDITESAPAEQRALAFRRHGLLESSIDVLLRRRRTADPTWLRRSRLLEMSRAQTAVVARLFEQTLRDVYGVAFSAAEARAAFHDMAIVYAAMTDRHAPFTRLLTRLAPLIDHGGVMDRAHLYPDAPLPLVVDLAQTRRRWFRPAVPDEPRTETLDEIFERATVETVRCLTAVGDLLEGARPEETADAIGDRNMFTGMPCADTRPLVAFSPHLAQLDGQGRDG
jgi:Zinc dependent phospholipase C